jgi:acyl-CoA thioester hydrolase
MLTEHEIEIRVRYHDADPMGLLHHANYFVYFEMGRTEMLRAAGGNYRSMEEEGSLVVVVKAECRFLRPARYDDLLRLRTTVRRITAAKIEHEYHLLRGAETLAIGNVAMAMVDRQGNPRTIPESLHYQRKSSGEIAGSPRKPDDGDLRP